MAVPEPSRLVGDLRSNSCEQTSTHFGEQGPGASPHRLRPQRVSEKGECRRPRVTSAVRKRQEMAAKTVPWLGEGRVVVLDGLGAHRTERVRELVEGRGADVVFLPSYSPELNPIEEAFSKIKQLVRKAGHACARRGDSPSVGDRNARRCGGLVRPRRLPSAAGSTLMNTAG